MEIRLHPLEFTQQELPKVCAATGDPAAWQYRMEVHKATTPLAFLLVFLGPPGWIVLLLILSRADSTYVDVPVSQPTMDRIVERRRRFRIMLAVSAVALVSYAFLAGSDMTAVSWLCLAVVPAMGIWAATAKTHRIRLSVDGVGLVTLRNVHPGFVTAMETRRQRAAATTPRL